MPHSMFTVAVNVKCNILSDGNFSQKNSHLISDDCWHFACCDVRADNSVCIAQQCHRGCLRWIISRVPNLSDTQSPPSAWQLANVLLQFVRIKSSRVAHLAYHEPPHVSQHLSRLWSLHIWAFRADAASRQNENAENYLNDTYTVHLDVFH